MALPGRVSKKKVGLLGGSFNPAHDGHVHISEQAITMLGLDEVWWLVSPQNPLKSEQDMATLSDRLLQAKEMVAENDDIVVCNLESHIGTVYTAQTLEKIVDIFPETSFVWLMGADNLAQIDQWYDWQKIFHLLPVAVFARGDFTLDSQPQAFATAFGDNEYQGDAQQLMDVKTPVWLFAKIALHGASSTKIRNNRVKNTK